MATETLEISRPDRAALDAVDMNGQRTVLAITYHFPPSAASGTHRLLGFARNLPRYGWKMDAVAPPSLPWEPVDDALLTQVPESTRVFPVKYPNGYATWPLRKMLGVASWLCVARRSLDRAAIIGSPHAVLTSGPPHCVHFAGYYLKRRFGIPWIADFRDPWISGHFMSKGSKGYPLIDRIGEPLVFQSADAIIVNAPNALKELTAEHPSLRSKIQYITNGFDPSLFSNIVRRPSPRITIAHVGELYAGRDPRPFLDAVQLMIRSDSGLRQQLHVELIGASEGSGLQLDSEISRRGLAGIVDVVPQVSYQTSLQRMVDADILLLVDSPNRHIGVPAKLYEYIGAKRPVLALARAESDVHWVLRESGLPFRLSGIQDVEGIATGLSQLLQEQLQTNPAAESQFSRASTAGKLAQILDRVSEC